MHIEWQHQHLHRTKTLHALVKTPVVMRCHNIFSSLRQSFSSPPNRSDYEAQVAVADTQLSAVLKSELGGMLMVTVPNRAGFWCRFYKHSDLLELHPLHQQ